jgi:dedicated sortase system histidine kinase
VRLWLQLILVSLLALCLPWAGCTYIKEMETALRGGQQEALLARARSVALMLNGRPDIVGELVTDAPATATGAPLYLIDEVSGLRLGTNDDLAKDTSDGAPLYLHNLTQPVTSDGYDNEWLDFADQFVRFTETGGADDPMDLNLVAAANDQTVYLYIRVADNTIVFHDPAGGTIANGDHVRLEFSNETFWLTPEGPGELCARRLLNGNIRRDNRICGAWRDTVNGYQIELGFPAMMLTDRFGVVAVDGNDPKRWAGSLAPNAEPGRLVKTSKPLSKALQLFSSNNLKLTIVDDDNWLRATAGELQYQPPKRDDLPPGMWLVEALYRGIMGSDTTMGDYQEELRGQLRRPEVNSALKGVEQKVWYTQAGSAVISAAVPLRYEGQVRGAVTAEQTSEQVLSLTNAAMLRLLALTLGTTLFIGLGLVGYASFLSFRIGRLSRTVNAVMAPDGQISGEFPEDWGKDEIGDLARRFGGLLGRVREYTEYLRTLSSKLSHELRTPLAVMRSSLDNLEHETLPAESRGYLERAQQASQRLSHILTAMSEASRVEASIKAAESEPVNLNAFMAGVVDGYRTVYPYRSIELKVPDNELAITGAPELLAQMFDKLIENAVDFCSADGSIRFGLHQEKGTAVVTVANDGTPLPEAMSGQLFDSMVSVRDGKSADVHLGLGLTIVRLVADYHHGQMEAENAADGTGVCFAIRLPLIKR